MGKRIKYNGKEYPSIRALSRELGFPEDLLQNRLTYGFTLEKAVSLGIPPKEIVVFGNSFKTLVDVAEFYGLTFSSLSSAVTRFETTETAVKYLLSREPITFKGRVFPSFVALSKTYKIDSQIVSNRLFSGWSLEDALLQPLRTMKNTKTHPFRGTQYNSLRDLANTYGFEKSFVVQLSRNYGLSFTETLEILVNFFRMYAPYSEGTIHFIPYAILDGKWYKTYEEFVTSIGLEVTQLTAFITSYKRKTSFKLTIKEALVCMSNFKVEVYLDKTTGKTQTTRYLMNTYKKPIKVLQDTGVITKIEQLKYPNLTYNPSTLATPKQDFDILMEKLRNK